MLRGAWALLALPSFSQGERMAKNSQVAGKVIRRRVDSTTSVPVVSTASIENEMKLSHATPAHAFESLSDKIARHRFFNRNWISYDLKAEFPHAPRLWHVDKMYPYATDFAGKHRPLLVDEVRTEEDFSECERKKKVLESHGYRYVILENDTSYEDALIQLGEL